MYHTFSCTRSHMVPTDNITYLANPNQNNDFQHGYQVYHPLPTTILYSQPPPPQHVQLLQQHQPLLAPPQQAPPPAGEPHNEQPNPAEARAQIVRNHRLVLTTTRGRRHLHAAIGSVVMAIIAVLMSTVAPWFQTTDKQHQFFCKDDYLFIFIIPPVLCIPLLFSNLAFVGRLCWWHCWTVTVISIGVPAGVVFVSFGSTLVAHSSVTVQWTTGAYFVILSYLACILSGLLFMKLAHLIEIGVPINDINNNDNNNNHEHHPITVHIGVDDEINEDGKYFVWDSESPVGSAKE